MMEENLYEILLIVIQTFLGCVAPVAISVAVKYISGNNWMPDTSDSALIIIEKMDWILFKGTIACFIFAAVLSVLWIIRLHPLYFWFLSFYLWSYPVICLCIYGAKKRSQICYRLIANILIQSGLIIIHYILKMQEGSDLSFLMGASVALNARCLYKYPYMKILRLGSSKNAKIQKFVCFSFSSGAVLFFYTTFISAFGDIDIGTQILGIFTIIFTVPFVVYILYEERYYLKIYKYTKVNIHTKDGKIIRNLYIQDINKSGDWFSVHPSEAKEIRIHTNNIESFEYFDEV